MTEDAVIRVLVVDDEASIREVLTDFLVLDGHDVTCAEDGLQALAMMRERRFDVLLLDLKMPGLNGLEVLEQVAELAPRAITIMMTGYGTVETAIAAMKRGAYDYVLKPFKVQEVIRLLRRGLESKRLQDENIQLREAVSLYEMSERMTISLALEPVYEIVLEAVRRELEADAAAIWAMPGLEGEARCVKRWGRQDLEPEQIEALDSLAVGPLLEALASGEPQLYQGESAWRLAGCEGRGRMLSLLAVPLRTKNRVIGAVVALAFDEQHALREGKRKMLAVLCGRASAAIENAWLYGDLKETFKQTIQALANLLEDKDPYTRGHSDRVSRYARMIAKGLGLGPDEVDEIADCALMHDIGKLGIRYEDLNKVEPLTEAEYEMFKSHTTRGKWILEPIGFLHHLIPGVYHHHERWDGRGYPQGLSGEAIPLVARILAIADTYDAMTSHRAYRRALPHDVAIREIQAFAGRQFDPALVAVFVREITQDKAGYHSKAQRWNALRDAAPQPTEGRDAAGE